MFAAVEEEVAEQLQFSDLQCPVVHRIADIGIHVLVHGNDIVSSQRAAEPCGDFGAEGQFLALSAELARHVHV